MNPTCGPDGIALPAGRMSCLDADGQVFFRSEADLRDGLAANAWLAGWDARTEVPVSSGARADLVLFRADRPAMVVEVKVELLTQRQFRRAFQQIDGYRLFFESGNVETAFQAVLTAVRIDYGLAAAFTNAYPSVTLRNITGTRTLISDRWAGRPERARQIRSRAREAARLSAHLERSSQLEAERQRRRHLSLFHRNYPAFAEMLAGAIGLTFEGRAA